jgi:xylulokinase
MEEFLIGCDIGTTFAKTTLVNLDGTIVGSGSVQCGIHIPGPNLVEQDPEELLIAAIGSIRNAIQSSGLDPAGVLGIGFSGQGPGCVPIDENINPLRTMHNYIDRRGEKEADWLLEHIGEEHVFQKTGNYIDPYYGGVKILWEYRHEPEIYEATYKFQFIKDFVVASLTGWIGTDYSSAGIYGIFYDIQNRRWIEDEIRSLDLDIKKLPNSVPCTRKIGGLTKFAAEALGLVEGTPVVAGTIDSCASYLAAGILYPGQSAITLGTSSDWGVECTGNQFVPRTICLPSAANSEEQHVIITTVPSSGGFLSWFRDLLLNPDGNKPDYQTLTEEAGGCSVGSNGLLALPHIAGKATPDWFPDPQSGFLGLTLTHSRGNIVRAIMESVAFAMRENKEWVIENGVEISPQIGLIGGGFKSQLWAQIVCDVLGIEGILGALSGEPAVGDAILAGVGVGAFPDTSVAIKWLDGEDSIVVKPIQANHEKYSQIFDLYKRFEEISEDITQSLKRISQES